MPHLRPLLAACFALVLSSTAPAAEPRVVTSIAPVNALVQTVMQGVGTSRQLVPSAVSPHGYALKPSDARALARADLVFWIGPGLEAFMTRPLESLTDPDVAVALGGEDADAPDGHSHGHSHDHNHGHVAGIDPHVWLDPARAADMLQTIEAALSRVYPAHRAAFAANTAGARATLAALENEVHVILTPHRNARMAALHDAYGHFTEHFGLQPFLALSLSPDRQPGAAHLAEVRRRIRTENVRCIFKEPQAPDRLAQLAAEGTTAEIAILDPVGQGDGGLDAYVDLIRDMATAINGCLTR